MADFRDFLPNPLPDFRRKSHLEVVTVTRLGYSLGACSSSTNCDAYRISRRASHHACNTLHARTGCGCFDVRAPLTDGLPGFTNRVVSNAAFFVRVTCVRRAQSRKSSENETRSKDQSSHLSSGVNGFPGLSQCLAGGPGFEPRLTESESAVLPLNYPPTAA